MHEEEEEGDTFAYQTWPERFCDMLGEIGVDASPKPIGTDDVEKAGDYYSRYFAQTPRMVTNRGCLDVRGSNIDAIQIIQKG